MAASALRRPALAGRIHRELTGAYAWIGRWGESLAHSRRAVELFGELHDDVGLARTHRASAC